MASRTIPSVLDSLSSSSLNKRRESAHPPSKKRKTTHENAAGQLSTTSIVIRAHAASLSDEPLVLEPITALPRSRLPLIWLDGASSSRSDAQPGGLFLADIPTLETDLQAQAEPTVLAVRLTAHGGLYVVERVKRGIYSLSRLARWVHEGDLLVAVKEWHGSTTTGMVAAPDSDSPVPDGLDWWKTAQIDEPISDLGGLSDRAAGLNIAMVFGPSDSDPEHDETSFVDVLEHRSQSLAPAVKGVVDSGAAFGPLDTQGSGDTDPMDVDGIPEPSGLEAQQSPEELLNGMRDHYLQALYVSKTSVAYFAKGPLTRCRAAFQPPGCEQPQQPTELITFYREAILAAKKIDLKYRETLPSVVRDAMLAFSDGEDAAPTKKRKSKKKKLGKNGLYPEEESFVRKWWKDRNMNETSAQETSREGESKKHISDLRLRETQLQILLILEAMALESSPTEKTKADSGKEKETPKKTKAKKPQDLSVLLELHVDRLCIWHAVSSEESNAADSAKTSSFNSTHLSGKKVESDAVRDFCTEVIIPFYAARLPDKCKLITRKFGVSGGISPVAKKTQSSTSKTQRVEPGSEVKRQQPALKSRRSLHRVLTDEKVASVRHPSLNRSKTAPSQQEIKRDSIEPLLPAVLSGSVRGGIQKAKRAENREVDLNAVARQHETKLRKVQMLVDQKKELDAAINALRKPNRELVANEIAEDATKRVSTGGGSSRKPKNPVRNPNGQGVQVMATPRRNRKQDAVVGLPPLPRSLAASRSFAGEMPDGPVAESSPMAVPSSSRRATSFSGADSSPFQSRGASNHESHYHPSHADNGCIEGTPSRPPSKLFQTHITDTPSASSKGKGLFRIPNLPAPRSATAISAQQTGPTTPVSSRHKDLSASSSQNLRSAFENTKSTVIMDTPPKQRDQAKPMPAASFVPTSASVQVGIPSPTRVGFPPAAIGTPVKGTAAVPVTPEKSQNIYAQLGWDDDEMDL
ncbi:DNA replication regulator Sld3 [Penicillium riverlandense]|uniref:DNA replication regulator Sld3 n=1 Tax=Penicillium riverlandense TaxID=1903569 RepID=UPI0025484037|nr:DNA replication regulator Sld3 [Penicillium riverlandense]KAJ5832269.1 DNA replication regulator Sld3 [Penicillium riverlandense]